MRIGEIAAQAEVSVQTLRYYERRGLLVAPTRRVSGYREYHHDAVQRIDGKINDFETHADRARTAIRGALAAIGAPIAWREWDCTDASTPESLRKLGSPSVLVNGRDVGCEGGTMAEADANSCRVYHDDCGCICSAPSVELILRGVARSGLSEAMA